MPLFSAGIASHDARLKKATLSFEDAERTVHIWPIYTEASKGITAQFEQMLAPDERERAERFRFDYLRQSFILARGALRVLLGYYLDVDPASVQFGYGSKGKPHIALPTRVRFNISHSDNLAVFAFAVGCDLGVDVERIRTLSDMQHVAERYFCFEEAAQLTSLPMDQRERAFFHCWTRKEAYVKAIGDGLSARLDNFQVTLEQNEPAAFLHLEHDRHAAKGWALHDLKLATNYVAALAYRGTPRHVCILPLIDAAELKQLHFRF